ncbi:energy transducer TonB family protein [Ketogulonicigenium vulgare]|uniref:energy transducer TonB family protein n=1 Tax=Ketogulonicigenium vulgare TaxID=92945 RepID=UPI002359616D|nr:energy transducer TonB [Ketogulonicigenium vulgare]
MTQPPLNLSRRAVLDSAQGPLLLRPAANIISFARRSGELIGPQHLRTSLWAEGLRWGVSTLAICALIGGAVFAATRAPRTPDGPAAPPPAIMMEFAPEIAAPEVEAPGTDLAPETPDQAPQQEIDAPVPDEPIPDEIREVPPEILPEAPPEDLPLEPPPEVPPEPLDEEPPEELPPAATPPDPDPIEVEELPEVETPALALSPPSRPQNLRTAPPPPPPQQRAMASTQSAPREVEAPRANTATATQNVTSQQVPNISPQQWQDRVNTHVNRFITYPAEARAARQQGTPLIRITLDDAGNVISASLARSSGYTLLDQAAVAMAYRASPLPMPPSSVPQRSIVIPAEYILR